MGSVMSKSVHHKTKIVVKRLKELERIWPRHLMLFSHNGTLELCAGHPAEGGECIATFKIQNDGGDV